MTKHIEIVKAFRKATLIESICSSRKFTKKEKILFILMTLKDLEFFETAYFEVKTRDKGASTLSLFRIMRYIYRYFKGDYLTKMNLKLFNLKQEKMI